LRLRLYIVRTGESRKKRKKITLMKLETAGGQRAFASNDEENSRDPCTPRKKESPPELV
jgi:hypothetical protein